MLRLIDFMPVFEKNEVVKKGWNDAKKAFVQHYDTDALDAGNLLIPFYGFLPYGDPRMVSTVQAIRKELYQDSLVYRLINVLQGAFFRAAERRIAYEEMAGSTSYRRYVECSYNLKLLDMLLYKGSTRFLPTLKSVPIMNS